MSQRPVRRAPLIALAALGLASLAVNASADATDPDLDQTVVSDEAIGDEQVVVDSGHVDIGPKVVDGRWQLLLRDDSVSPPVWRHAEDIVMDLGDNAILPAPDDEQFSFIDAEPGSDVYVIPQTQATDVVWVGWNSQDPDVAADLPLGMTLRLHEVSGPGQFTLFLQSGNFDAAEMMWTSASDEPQDIWAETNTHVHGNWVFTEPGVYLMDVEVLGEQRDGTTQSARTVLRFAVGDATDPQDAFDAELLDAEVSSDGTDGAQSSDASESGEGSVGVDETAASAPAATGLLIGGGAAIVVLAGVLMTVLRSRRARRLAETQEPTHG